jgi:hypothetical protein
MEENIKVYIKINDKNVVININSGIFLTDIIGWICVDEGQGDKYAHAQGNYLENGLMDMFGKYNYKYENNTLSLLTDSEKAILYPPTIHSPSDQQRIGSVENTILTIM